MPRRKIVDPADKSPEALAMMQKILGPIPKNDDPRKISPEDERDFIERRAQLPVVDESSSWTDNSSWVIARRNTLVITQRPSDSRETVDSKYRTLMLKRRGKWLYREPGKAGADLPMPPWAYRDALAERDQLAEQSKRERQPRLVAALRECAQATASRVIDLASADTKRGRIKRIAQAAGCSVATVKRVLSQEKGSKQK